ncbi:transglutaminase-like domain-containing protein [Enterovirga rhinocerotis]|uniref:Transglutaminase-like putative cysteine protease n=1 Tax=Enterovirga rhinocerotis TaxID=1339210 RepID=A0A4R7BK24_9HYPH|nr:transglutaminase domain-containing protein [Enterovirga rhinocerotis]TDR84555.1 transglutaminase-like putative cysteine protease [Enterovirga rhinocerotis]
MTKDIHHSHPLHRRHLLALGGGAAAALLARPAFAQPAPALFAPKPGAWRTYEVVTRVELPAGDAQAWVPVPSVNEAGWFRSSDSTFSVQGGEAKLVADPVYGARAVHARWASGAEKPVLEVTSRVQARDRAADLGKPEGGSPLGEADRKLYLSATDLIPTGGIVKTTSDRIVAGKASDLDKARAIYDWVVENSFRNAATRGCGIGDIAAMLTSGNLGGKCADLNALFVGLARAAGIPARDVYGLRVAPSQFGYKSLGAGSEVVTKAQHCRAEAWLDGHGWVAVDPADVRKVVLEEPPGKLAIDDPKVAAARTALFGSWEGNWLAYNFAHDVALPGAAGPKVEFLMYPQAEIKGARLDCLDPDGFKYTIRAREVSV